MTLKIFDESTTTEEVSYGSKDDVNDIPSEIPLMFFDANPYELPRPADGDIVFGTSRAGADVQRPTAVYREDGEDVELRSLEDGVVFV